MIHYLNEFSTLADFNASKDSLATPQVCSILDTGVAYKRSASGEFTAHDGTAEKVSLSSLPQQPIDLGLPSGLKWASCNVGANAPEEYGLYFAWGETQGYGSDVSDGHLFNIASYQLSDGSYGTLTKYNYNSRFGTVDNKTTLEAVDDAASQNLSIQWRMPTQAEFYELLDNTTATWATQNGIEGILFTATNGNSIFLPAAGNRFKSELVEVGFSGNYWSSSLGDDMPTSAFSLYFYSDLPDPSYFGRDTGCSVRPVLEIS